MQNKELSGGIDPGSTPGLKPFSHGQTLGLTPNFVCWADNTCLVLEFLISRVLIHNYRKKSYKKIKIPIVDNLVNLWCL